MKAFLVVWSHYDGSSFGVLFGCLEKWFAEGLAGSCRKVSCDKEISVIETEILELVRKDGGVKSWKSRNSLAS